VELHAKHKSHSKKMNGQVMSIKNKHRIAAIRDLVTEKKPMIKVRESETMLKEDVNKYNQRVKDRPDAAFEYRDFSTGVNQFSHNSKGRGFDVADYYQKKPIWKWKDRKNTIFKI
jgi:hypothetical protein